MACGESTYRRLAPVYDRWVGEPFFGGVRVAFRHLVSRYGIRFRSAADLGCGTGLFACHLAREWGVPAVGVDRSAAMLRRASRRCPEGVRFLRQDIRELRLPHKVDLATANFDTLNHLTGDGDLARALDRIARCLTPGGHFVFDILTPCLGRTARPICRDVGRAGKMCQRIEWVSPGRLFRTRLTLWRRGAAEPRRVAQLERAYPVREVVRALGAAGFQVRGVHEAETLRPATGCAPRVVIVARLRSVPRSARTAPRETRRTRGARPPHAR